MISIDNETLDVRQSLGRFPSWTQIFWTEFSGKALPGQTAPPFYSATWHSIRSLLWLLVGLIFGVVVVTQWWWFLLLPISWAMILHGLRDLRMLVFHQAAHGNLFANKKTDRFIGRLLASLIIVQNYDGYKKDHVLEHHSGHHMTLRDPTVQAFLVTLELAPRMSIKEMKSRIFRKLISPSFHLSFLIGRIRGLWSGGSSLERSVFILLHLFLPVLIIAFGYGWIYVAVVILPWTICFQIVNTLRLLVKHSFPAAGMINTKSREHFAGLSHGVFFGDPIPLDSGSFLNNIVLWAHWTLRMIFIHAPLRFIVITADTPVHDWHHRNPRDPQWWDYLYRRERDSQKSEKNGVPYTQIWGFGNAVNYILGSLSMADRDVYDPSKLGAVSKRSLYLAFDD